MVNILDNFLFFFVLLQFPVEFFQKMLSNKQLKYLRSLHQRKFRQKYGNFIAEGVKTVREILNQNTSIIEGIFALPGWINENKHLLVDSDDKVWEVNEKELTAISQLKTANQVICVLKQPVFSYLNDDLSNRFSLFLDNIRDPGNMGTILRIADWFGIKWVFCSKNCVEVFNPKVVQASMGAFLRVRVESISLNDIRSEYPNLPVLGTSLSGESIFKSRLPKEGIIVIGNESTGISSESETLITQKILIPRHPEGGAESLNAAVATGIICSYLQKM